MSQNLIMQPSMGKCKHFVKIVVPYCTPPLLSIFCRLQVGWPSKLVSIRNNRNWNRNQFLHHQKQNVCFGCFGVLIEPKHTEEKPKQFDRDHFAIFSENLGLCRYISVCFVLWQNSLFRLFASIPKQRVSMFRCFN